MHASYITVEWNEKQCSASLLGIYLDQVRDASYKVNQVIVAPLGKHESKTLHSSIVSPVSWCNFYSLLIFLFRNLSAGSIVV